MKKVLISLFAVAAMVSCANDELVELNQEAISFENAFVDNATRTIDPSITTGTISTFKVYGNTQGDGTGEQIVKIFENVPVNKDGANWAYDAGYNQYWIAGNTYNFAALVNAERCFLDASFLPKTVGFTVTDGATDLLYARTETPIVGLASGNQKVAFTFNHLLSKVQFTFKNTMITNANGNIYTYRISNISINGAHKTGKCTLATPEWKDYNGTVDLAFGNITNDDVNGTAVKVGVVGAADSATSQYALLLIPAAYDDLNITCIIETLYNGSVVDTQAYNQDVDVTLAPGNAYNFVISKGAPGEQIQFTVTEVNEWATPTGGPDVNL